MKPQIIVQYKLAGLVPTSIKYPDLNREGGNPILTISYKVGKCEAWYNRSFLKKGNQDIVTKSSDKI